MARPNLSLHQSRFSPSPVWLFCRPILTLSACSGTLRLDYFGTYPRPRGRPRSRSHRFPLLEKPRPIRSVRWHCRRERAFPWVLGRYDPSSLLFHRNRDRRCESFRLACRAAQSSSGWHRNDVIKTDFQIAAGEAKNPRRNLPKAIRRVYIRILLFYIGGVTIIGLLVPSTDPGLKLASGTAAASPFVIAIKRSGIKFLPGVFLSHMSTAVEFRLNH